MKKRIVWILTAALMLLAVPLHAFADDTVYSQGYLLYKIEDGGITIVRYVGDDEETVIIPNMIANYPVSKIAAGTFDDCPQVKTVYLPDTVMEIEEGAIPSGIHVIIDYNLVTDHPDPSAEPIVPAPTGEVVSSGENTGGVTNIDETLLHPQDGQQETIHDEDLPTPGPTSEATPAPTEEPTADGTEALFETTPAPENDPVAQGTAKPVDDKTQPVSDETQEPVSGDTEQANNSLTWLWVLLAVLAAGGAACGATVLIRKKRNA